MFMPLSDGRHLLRASRKSSLSIVRVLRGRVTMVLVQAFCTVIVAHAA